MSYDPQTSANIRREEMKAATTDLEPPHGCNFYDEDERAFYNDLIRSKARHLWTKAALGIAFKVTRIETLLRRGEKKLEEFMDDGADLFDPDSIANGYVKEINLMRNHQLGLMRALGLTFTAIQSQTAARRTAAENGAREAVETAKKPESGMGLLAFS